MFDSVTARYLLRAFLVGVAAFAGILAALAYAGIGAAVPAVEPSIGNKREG